VNWSLAKGVLDPVDPKRQRGELATSSPEPGGHVPAQIFGAPDDSRYGVLRLTPTQIALVQFPAPPGRAIIWRA
jgi:hypothetical protein